MLTLLLLLLLLLSAEARPPSPTVAALTGAEAAADVLAAADALTRRDLRRHPADIERALRKLALNSHHAGRAGDADRYQDASEAYDRYFVHFADHENAYEMRYAHGELLYKLKRYDEAFDAYNVVITLDPRGKRTKFCANSAVYAAQKMSLAHPGAHPARGSGAPASLSAWEAKYLNALLLYASMYPDDQNTPGALYKSGYLLYSHNQFREAGAVFLKVIDLNPATRDAELAANLLLDALVITEDWEGLREVVSELLAIAALGSDRFKAELVEIQEQVEVKLREGL